MSNEPRITIVGNLTDDPEMRFTPNGVGVTNFTVASTPRIRNAAGDWEDGTTYFQRCTVWRNQAENVVASLVKGDRVIVLGDLTAKAYVTREGESRTSMELRVISMGPSLEWASTDITRNQTSEPEPEPEPEPAKKASRGKRPLAA